MPAPKKAKKKPEKTPEAVKALKRALLRSSSSARAPSPLVLTCVGENDPRWDEETVTILSRLPLYVGYPEGTEKTSVGNDHFKKATPSAEGVYTFKKIVYDESLTRGQRYEKTGEKVYYRLVEESDVEAIKKAFPHLVF